MDLIDRIIENSKPYNIDISFGEYLESEKLNYQTELNELEELPTEQGNTPLIGYIIGGIIGFLVYLVLWICLYFLGVIK
jgi:hypothetical protein